MCWAVVNPVVFENHCLGLDEGNDGPLNINNKDGTLAAYLGAGPKEAGSLIILYDACRWVVTVDERDGGHLHFFDGNTMTLHPDSAHGRLVYETSRHFYALKEAARCRRTQVAQSPHLRSPCL
ncbi:MAG: hypothetical protein QGI34_05710 [Candidatus Latescibacteria bacterium]|nr:hypothetical protein [Candidatus Latescibacterota bacterium]